MRHVTLIALGIGLTHCTDIAGPSSTGPTDATTANDSPSGDTGSPDTRHVAVSCALVEQDQGDDGTIDNERRLEFNADHEILLETDDLGANGSIEIRFEHSYDGERWAIDSVYDMDGDGVYQTSGYTEQILVNGMFVRSWFDSNGDGTYESELTTEAFTAAGDPETQTFLLDGAEPTTYMHSYDGERRRTEWTLDRGMNGTIDWREHVTYSDTLDVLTRDGDGDGTDDEVTETQYDAQGRPTLIRTDSPLGKPWEIVETHLYGPNGLTETVRTTASNTITTTYVRDSLERVLESTVTRTGVAPMHTVWTWSDCTEP